MDVTASVDAPCSPEVLFAIVEDLARYPSWLSIVPRAEPIDDGAAADDEPAWSVELRGRLGPLARSKRLRMVRVEHDPTRHVRFERREHDGRDHSPWVLEADVVVVDPASSDPADARSAATGRADPEGAGRAETGGVATSRLIMRLHYGGSFGGSVLERLLRDEIESSKPRLLALVAEAG